MKFLIIDEISFIGLDFLEKIHFKLMKAKSNNLNFGGVHVLFVGDFFQLAPIRQYPIYKLTKEERELRDNYITKQKNLNINLGRILWLSLTHVIFLTNNHRQKEDPEYFEILERIKYGKVNSQDYKILQSRILYKNINNMAIEYWYNIPCLISYNKLREQINNLECNRYSLNNNLKIYYCKSINNNNKLSDNVLKYISTLNEKETGNTSYNLPLILNCHYYLTMNIGKKIGLVNTNEVILKSIYMKNIPKNNSNSNIIQLDEMPKYLIVQFVKSEINKNNYKFSYLGIY